MTDADTLRDTWIKRMRAAPDARVRLLCIPYAGGGAWSFRAWPQHLPADVEVLSVQLPGREDRLGDAPLHHVAPVAQALAPIVEDLLDKPLALFGHSMGGLIAFELLRELRRRGARAPAHLFASAFRAPQIPPPNPPIHELPDEQFVEAVSRLYDAIPPAAREHEELMELLLPGLRADIAVCDSYAYADEPKLDVPITAIGGRADHHVPEERLAAWAEQTTGTFELVMIDGDHFFLQSAVEPLLAELGARLRRLAT